MYRVIIVDDEANIRQGLRKILQRFAPGWELVGEAEDGESGLRQVLRLQPDLVILDFRMPGLNGIECCERIASEAPRVHRILLTAYQEFELAKQAISHGVTAFITKPLDREELLHTLRRVEEQVEQERSQQAKLMSLQQAVQKAAPLAEKLYYQHFIFGQDYHDLEQFIVEAGYPIPHIGDRSTVVILAISPDWIEKGQFSAIDVELFGYALTNFVQEWYSREDHVYVLQDHIGQVVIIRSYPSETQVTSLGMHESARRLKAEIAHYFGRTVTIGISGIHRLSDAPQAYQEASLAVTYRLVYGGDSVVMLPALESDGALTDTIYEQLELSLEQLLLGREQEAYAILDQLTRSEQIMPALLHRIVIHYLLRVGAQLRLMDLDVRRITGKPLEDWLAELESSLTRATMMSRMRALMQPIACEVRRERDAADTPLIDKIKSYVMQVLTDGVSLQSVADRFGMNASYFSRWFKYETGQNFVVFLRETRVARAKALIEQGGLTVQEISQQVGYADSKHFYRVFKEHTGYSPSDYKRLRPRR
ncbi:DNA-binding response regulator [Paenibacillus sp. 598K]|uniref:response regulator n=1 Tax=Paenibacillus sp. 598K TaxID=1117987 RepID=UPI000FF9CEF3|nr:response regulator [Paenibacillus sp. 598K]GBF74254.1 DNA-binding response regulator [Paenibacillus sp. 598K]